MRALAIAWLGVWLGASGCVQSSVAQTEDPGELLQDATVTLEPARCAGVVAGDPSFVLTAAHCLQADEGRVEVSFRDGGRLSGKVIELDRRQDLALIRLDEPAPVRALTVADALPPAGMAGLFAGRNDYGGPVQQIEVERLGRCPSLPGVPQALFTSLRGKKGDSGAPVVDEQLRVVGLVHGGAACSIAAPTADFATVIDQAIGGS